MIVVIVEPDLINLLIGLPKKMAHAKNPKTILLGHFFNVPLTYTLMAYCMEESV